MRRTISGAIVLVLLLGASYVKPRASAAKEGHKFSRADAKKAAARPKLGPAFETDPELMDVFRALYEQNFPDARARFTAWSALHPEEAFGQVSLAAGYLFDEFNHHGVLTSEFFTNDEKFLHGIEGEPHSGRMQGFHEAIEKARVLANNRLKAAPGDPNALFALT